MKLYVFRPNEYGLDTYFVMAESKDAAKNAVEYAIKPSPLVDGWKREWGGLDFLRGDEMVYNIEIYGEGEVGRNSND